MCPGGRDHGNMREFNPAASATARLDNDLRRDYNLAGLAKRTDVQRNRVDEVYWPMAEQKGIHLGDTFVVKGKSLQVKALIMKGQHCFVVLNDESGFNRTEINLKNSFWDEERSKGV